MRTFCSIWKSMAAGLTGGLAGSWTMNQFQELLSKAQNSSRDGSQKSEQHSRDEPATVKAAEEVARRASSMSSRIAKRGRPVKLCITPWEP